MRIHSDTLTRGDIEMALQDAKLPEVFFSEFSGPYGSRSRSYAYEVKLCAHAGKDRLGRRRRPPHSGVMPGDPPCGATYNEWGFFIAELYLADEAAKIGPYTSGADFADKTDYAFPMVAV